MKPIIVAPLVAAGVFLGIALNSRGADDGPVPAAKVQPRQWEHLALSQAGGDPEGKTAAKIVELGRKGWELVAVTEREREQIARQRVYYFKRPL